MKNKLFIICCLLLAVLMLFSSCGGAQAPSAENTPLSNSGALVTETDNKNSDTNNEKEEIRKRLQAVDRTTRVITEKEALSITSEMNAADIAEKIGFPKEIRDYSSSLTNTEREWVWEIDNGNILTVRFLSLKPFYASISNGDEITNILFSVDKKK